MKHPEILLLPVLMFADYFLTVLGAVAREGTYARHFRTEHYELNPLLQKSIARKQWFNLRHTLAVFALSSFLTCLLEVGDMPDPFNQFVLGTVLAMFATLVGRHVGNLLIFRYLAKHPDQISGQVTMAHPLVLSLSSYQMMEIILPLALIAIFSRNCFAGGALLGTAVVFCKHLSWMRMPIRRQSPPGEPSPQSGPPLSADEGGKP